MESEDKNCTIYDLSIRNIQVGIRSEPSVAPRSPVGHRATEDHTNEHYTQHSVSAGVNRFDRLSGSGLTRRLPPG